MSNAQLVVDADRLGYYICWYFPDEGDQGGTLGESTYTAAQLAKAEPADWEHIKATITAGQTAGVERAGHDGYRWESRTDAFAALRAIKAAIKDKSNKPWPEWAVQAKAAGWKPPKGWKP
jgi:hypothetical protein